jgi:hypothetical protein
MRLGFAVLVSLLVLATPAVAHADIEDYASYDPQRTCHPEAKRGTDHLAHWVVRRYGGAFGGTSRSCERRATSEHQNGRAFDWTLDARRKADRRKAKAFLGRILATDRWGNTDAWARRMGVMYVIWNDQMYPAWERFAPEPYLSSSCDTRRDCSPTLRHRDHLHVSLSRRGARGVTSWYDGRL